MEEGNLETYKTNPDKFNNSANILKALAHPVRLCMVKGLYQKGPTNVTNIQECLEMPQSTTSQHLSKLKSVGIISGERRGLEIVYSLSNKKVENIIKELFNLD